MKKIAIVGATGMIGIPVTKELIKGGFEITALVRDVNKAKNIFPHGVVFVKGDLNDKSSLAEALKNSDGLYINISTKDSDKEDEFNPETGGIENILAAAKESNVKQIIYLSSFLARNYKGDWWVMNAKKTSIAKVKNCGIPYTIFYPSNFMENFKNGMRQGKKIAVIGKYVNKAWLIAAEDFGRMVVNAFKTEKAMNNEYAVQGTEAFTMDEAANVYVENYSKEKLTVSKAPPGMMKFLSIFIKPLRFVTKLMAVILNNQEVFESQATWDELGKPRITLAEFAKK